MADFFDIPLSGEPLQLDSSKFIVDTTGFYVPKPVDVTDVADNVDHSAILSLIDAKQSEKNIPSVRIPRKTFESMKGKIAELSSELIAVRRQNEQFVDFLMRVTYTLRELPHKETELKALLDFLSKFLKFDGDKVKLEVTSLIFAIGSMPKTEFSSLVGAINVRAWTGFDTEGVLVACRENGIEFPDIVPIVNLVKSYLPKEITDKHKN